METNTNPNISPLAFARYVYPPVSTYSHSDLSFLPSAACSTCARSALNTVFLHRPVFVILYPYVTPSYASLLTIAYFVIITGQRVPRQGHHWFGNAVSWCTKRKSIRKFEQEKTPGPWCTSSSLPLHSICHTDFLLFSSHTLHFYPLSHPLGPFYLFYSILLSYPFTAIIHHD